MTLFECMKSYLSGNATLAAKVTGGFHPGRIPQNRTDGQVICIMRYVSGVSQPPTHDSGPSPWSRVRLELTFWGTSYKVLEQCASLAEKMFTSTVYLGGSANGLFGPQSVQGPRDLADVESKLMGIQIDVIGLLNGDTIS